MSYDKIFAKPEKPFLLISEDREGIVSYLWLETEDDLLEVAEEFKSFGDTIVYAIEIGSCRNVDLSKLEEYTYEKFLEEVCDAYKGKSKCVIEIGMENEIQIMCNGNKFSCSKLNIESDDLDSVIAEIFRYTNGEQPSYVEIKE